MAPLHTQFDVVPAHVVNLQSGGPSRDLLPIELLRASASLALGRDRAWAGEEAGQLDPRTALQYGPDLGDSTVRSHLASFLSRVYRHGPDEEQIVDPFRIALTPGASVGLQWALLGLARPVSRGGRTLRAFMPQSSYFLAFDTFRNIGFRFPQDAGGEPDVEGIEEDGEGILVDALEARLEALKAAHPAPESMADETRTFRHILYLVPSHSNPTGSVLAAERRRQIVELASKHDMLVLCDDVYDLLSFPRPGSIEPPARLVAYDQAYGTGRNVISNSSFSKILGPGTRCGWYEADESLLKAVSMTGAPGGVLFIPENDPTQALGHPAAALLTS
jgi:DNA-binding transcriptional MocR family regulator